MAAAEIPVMIMVSGNFFCSLRGHHRQLYTNIVFQCRTALLFTCLFGFGFVFVWFVCVCVCIVFKYCSLIYSSTGVSLCKNAVSFTGIYFLGIYGLWIITVVSRIQQCYQFFGTTV